MEARDYLIELYLDYRNNFVSHKTFAEYHGLLPDEAKELLRLSKSILEHDHPDI